MLYHSCILLFAIKGDLLNNQKILQFYIHLKIIIKTFRNENVQVNDERIFVFIDLSL